MPSRKFKIKIFKTKLFGRNRNKNKCYCKEIVSGENTVWIRYSIVDGGVHREDGEYTTRDECVAPCV